MLALVGLQASSHFSVQASRANSVKVRDWMQGSRHEHLPLLGTRLSFLGTSGNAWLGLHGLPQGSEGLLGGAHSLLLRCFPFQSMLFARNLAPLIQGCLPARGHQ